MSKKPPPSPPDYESLIREAVGDAEAFRGLTCSKPAEPRPAGWLRVTARPVRIRGKREVQFAYFDGRQTAHRNFAAGDVGPALDELFGMAFTQLHVRSAKRDVHVRITRKGKALISHGKATGDRPVVTDAHDRAKPYALTVENATPLLRAIGVVNRSGRIRPSRQAKFRQVNAFVGLVQKSLAEAGLSPPLHIVDCGCGSADLTFAAHHFLNNVRGISARVVGIDTNEKTIANCCALRDVLGGDGLDFRVSRIADFAPGRKPDVVLSLHACDTATDEALAQGVRWGSAVILAAPCCQHELHHELSGPHVRPITRHGILRERLADILTDSFRALALRVVGYRASVIEFVSTEHTAKNLMVCAEKTAKSGDPEAAREYKAFKDFWGVTPRIEELLADRIGPALEAGE